MLRLPFPFALAALFFACTQKGVSAEPTAGEVFAQRILPILKSPNPSSCTQCHLAGVDLKDYLLGTHEQTFASLRDQGLINLDEPHKSKILELIQRGANQTSQGNLIHAKARQAEYDALSSWIKTSAADPALRSLPRLEKEKLAKPKGDDAVIRHARQDRLLASFEQNVWAMRFRCMNCHTEGTAQNGKLVQKHGERVAWVKGEDAQATMTYLLGGPLIDAKVPENSLLLLKPLGQVEHEGGIKFLLGDQGYQAFRTWLEDVAAIRQDKYKTPSDLPKPVEGPARFGSDVWFKLEETPPEWADRLLQVKIFAWNAEKRVWETQPIATTDRGVFGKGKLWQHNLTLLATPGSEVAKTWRKGKPTLPAGRYLVKVYVDREGKLAKDWQAQLADGDYVGQAEFQAKWGEGYGAMTIVDARTVKR